MDGRNDLNAPLLPITRTWSGCSLTSVIVSLFTLNNFYMLLGPLLSLVIYLSVNVKGPTMTPDARNMLAAAAWVFAWWMTEAVPMAVASMSPLFLFPLFGIASSDHVASCYMDDIISLVLGSFILAIAVEHYNIHWRLALNITMVFCGDPVEPSLLLLGICATTAFVSMWMHNVASAVMMMPVATGILQRLPSSEADDPTGAVNRFCRAVVLGVIYSAAIGGMSTLTGTGVNLILVGMWKRYFPEANPISFSTWFFFGFPLAVIMFICMWGIICCLYCSKGLTPVLSAHFDKAHLKRELQVLGPMSFAEKMVLSIFSMLIVLWMTRNISDDIPGWGVIFNGKAGDGTVSVMMATLLFIIPNNKQTGEKLMDWGKCKSLPWNIILLLGAGFAIADGVRTSGLADVLSEGLAFLEVVPYWAIAPAISLVSAIVTEFTSNNATTTLVLPLLIQIAQSMRLHPLLLMVPGAVGSQFAYLLPTGTPSNVVGFTTGYIEIKDMMKVGIPLKICGVLVLSVLMPTLGAYVFGTSKEISYPNSWLQKSMEHLWVNNF